MCNYLTLLHDFRSSFRLHFQRQTIKSTMKVILVGYSKTGTKTMASAFRTLGMNTYDLMENYFYAYKGWCEIFDGKATPEDIRTTFEGVDALTDTPVYYYWRELHEAFPEAKLVLTIRDEDAWYKSFLHQVKTLNESFAHWFLVTFSSGCWARHEYRLKTNSFIGHTEQFPRPKVVLMNEKIIRGHYRYHNDDLVKNISKDKLLVYKVQDGWAPLCQFLDLEIPDQPFPHENKSGEAVKEFSKTHKVVAVLFRKAIIPFSVFAFLTAFVGYKFVTSSFVCDFVSVGLAKFWDQW